MATFLGNSLFPTNQTSFQRIEHEFYILLLIQAKQSANYELTILNDLLKQCIYRFIWIFNAFSQ